MGKKVKTPAKMRRQGARLGKVTRGAGGNVTMIDFIKYTANQEAPAIFVNTVGGVYRIGENSVQVVFVIRLHDPETGLEARQVVSLIWDEKDWLDTPKIFRFAMMEWQRTKRGDGSRKRIMQAGMN